MKITALFIAFFVITAGNAQNKNIKDETVTTITKVNHGDGVEQVVKNEKTREVQLIELDGPKDKTVNRDVKPSPVIVEKSTEVINPDGSVRIIDQDRSAYYMLDGKKYRIDSDNSDYTLTTENNKEIGKIKKTSVNSYLFVGKNKTAIAYFDTNGNLVLESYNPKTDTVTFETFTVLKE